MLGSDLCLTVVVDPLHQLSTSPGSHAFEGNRVEEPFEDGRREFLVGQLVHEHRADLAPELPRFFLATNGGIDEAVHGHHPAVERDPSFASNDEGIVSGHWGLDALGVREEHPVQIQSLAVGVLNGMSHRGTFG